MRTLMFMLPAVTKTRGAYKNKGRNTRRKERARRRKNKAKKKKRDANNCAHCAHASYVDPPTAGYLQTGQVAFCLSQGSMQAV